jgi:hypothetical protein
MFRQIFVGVSAFAVTAVLITASGTQGLGFIA